MKMLVAFPAALLAFALQGGSASAQTGPCAASPGEMARALVTARTPVLTPQQKALFDAAVAALRRGDSAGAGRQLGALLKANPALGKAPGLCALVHAAVREGTLQRQAQLADAMRAVAKAMERQLAATAERGEVAQYDLQKSYQDYQQAVSTIAAIQKSVYDDAMKIIGNLKS